MKITLKALGSIVRAICDEFEENERNCEQNGPFVKHLRKRKRNIKTLPTFDICTLGSKGKAFKKIEKQLVSKCKSH